MAIDDKFFGDDDVGVVKRPVVDDRGADVDLSGVEMLTLTSPDVDEVHDEPQVVEEVEVPEVVKPQPRRGKSRKVIKNEVTDGTDAGKILSDDELRQVIIDEMIDKTRRQLVTKEVDIRVYQMMSNQALDQNMRQRMTSTYEAASRELKEIRLKLNILLEIKDVR